MKSTATPGVALRLTAAAGAVASLLAVVSGATGAGAPHRELAALALPPLLALVLAAWFAHRRLLAPALVALLLFVAAAAGTSRTTHVALASLAFAAAVVLAAATLRGEPGQRGALRDYITLTKPRIMTLLLLTGACGMVVGARGIPPARAVRRDDARPRARVRRRERTQSSPRP